MTDRHSPAEYDALGRQFDALGDPLRRRLVVDLLSVDGSGDPVELSIDGERAGSRAVELHHAHLPRLAEFGYVVWEESPLVVRRGPRIGEIEPLLELLDEHSESLVGQWPTSDVRK